MAENVDDAAAKDAQEAQPAGDEGQGGDNEEEGLPTYPLVVVRLVALD